MNSVPPLDPMPPEPPEDARITKGKALVEMMWWSLAKRIVRLAADHYKWDEEQLVQATELFLRPGDYRVTIL